jgi:hypothetical protein
MPINEIKLGKLEYFDEKLNASDITDEFHVV